MHAVVLDGDNLVKRCIMATAMDDFRAGGVYSGGVYNALNSLATFLRMPEVRASAIYACWDCGIPSRRLSLLPDYKAERARRNILPPNVKESAFKQVGLVRDILHATGVVSLQYKEREADDVVAACVRVLVSQGHNPVVISSDHDLFQCVHMGASVWNLSRREWVDVDNFEATTGVTPEVYVLYRALKGDSSDGIAGCTGCGEVRSRELVTRCVQVEGVPFTTLSPLHQLRRLAYLLTVKSGLEKLSAVECNVLDELSYLERVVQAIDLQASFGGTKGLSNAMLAPSALDRRSFMQQCGALNIPSTAVLYETLADAATRRSLTYNAKKAVDSLPGCDT